MSLNTILATAPLTATGYHLKATGTALGQSLIWDNGTNVGIGNTNTSYTLDVSGTGNFSSTAYTNLTVNGTNATGWGNNIAFKSVGTDFGYIGSIGSLLGNTTKDMAIWATAGNGFSVYTNGNNQRMTITSAGNVLIGKTSSTGGVLQVSNGTNMFNVDYDANGPYITAVNNANTVYKRLTIDASEILFDISAAEKMRITSGGYLKQSNTGSYGSASSSANEFNSNVADWTVVLRNTQASNPYGFYTEYVSASPNNAANEFIYCRDSSAVRFRVASNGNAYNTTGVYTSGASDIRYKEQVIDANSQWDDIKNLRVVNFKFIKDVEENGDNALRHIGFIAQEVEKVSPNLIEEMTDKETGETWKTIKASIIHTKAIKALQECMTKIEQLSKQNEELSNRLIKLESK